MRFEYCLDGRADPHVLPRIAEQVANHAHIDGMRKFDQHGDIGTVAVQRRMRGKRQAVR